jgi:type IV pilus assembly protein PilW
MIMRKLSSRQSGMSLISLMVGLTIGLLLLAGLFQIWLQTRQTFGAQGQLAQLQDNERMVLTTMANTIQTGGYYPIYLNYSATPPATPYTSSSLIAIGNFTTAGQSLYGTYSATPPGDTLSVRFIADNTSTTANNTTLDCQGQTQATGTLVTNTYQINGGLLQCSTDGSKTWQTIINNPVANMTILYGIDTLGNGDGTQLEYLTADKVQAGTYWGKVISVQIQLTFNNPLYGQPGQSGQAAFLPVIKRTVAIAQTPQ